MDYADLKRRIKAAGLLESQPRYFALKFAVTALLFASNIAIVIMFDHPAIVLAAAVFLGFLFTHVGFLGHDLAHRQITHHSRLVSWLGLIVGNLLIVQRQCWIEHSRRLDRANAIIWLYSPCHSAGIMVAVLITKVRVEEYGRVLVDCVSE